MTSREDGLGDRSCWFNSPSRGRDLVFRSRFLKGIVGYSHVPRRSTEIKYALFVLIYKR